MEVDIANLSETQVRVVLYLSQFSTSRQIAGYRRAKYLSASRALVRKGLAYTYQTGHYGLTEQGRELAAQLKAS